MKKFETILIILIIIAFISSLFIQGEGYKSDIRDLEQKVSFTESKHKKLKAKTSVELKSSHEKIKTLEDEYKKLEKSKADEAKALNNQIDELHAKVNEVQGQLDEKSGELESLKAQRYGSGGVTATDTPRAVQRTAVYNSGGYIPGQCTAYAKHMRPDIPNNLGNAGEWLVNAQAMGLSTGNIPKVNSIAVTTKGYYGHVGVVTAITGNRVHVSEMNVKGEFIVSEAWYDVNYWDGFIY